MKDECAEHLVGCTVPLSITTMSSNNSSNSLSDLLVATTKTRSPNPIKMKIASKIGRTSHSEATGACAVAESIAEVAETSTKTEAQPTMKRTTSTTRRPGRDASTTSSECLKRVCYLIVELLKS